VRNLLLRPLNISLRTPSLAALSADPLLVWNYGVMAVLAFVTGVVFWWSVSDLDAKEDELNDLAAGHVGPYDEKR
jgi:POT family proton-dependent oligopeptide transporter